YGINTFLHQEVDPAKVEAQLTMIADAGFTWIREEFPWEEIEVDGRGQFTDSRNDMNGDGVRDTISGWAKFDRIVALAEQYGIHIQARLSNPPAWAQATGVGDFTPPLDTQDYVNYAAAVASQYKGRVRYYQVWNEPNIFPEWGWQPDGTPRPIDPEAYADLLCRTYAALKAVDPEIVVISGALAPTVALSDRDLSDLVFLQRLYDAGAGDCFDVLSMQGYGLNSGPTDRRMRPTTINFGRSAYLRDIMVANGDASTPIWISEAAWNAVPSAEVAPQIIDRYFGGVTPEQAAQYMPLAYQRAREEWAWVGVMNYWFFTLPDNRRQNEAFYYFKMVEPDYAPESPTFTPLPIYHAMRDYIANQTPTLYQGVHQLDAHWAVTYSADAQVFKADGAQFDEAAQARQMSFTVYGTDVRLRWRGGSIQVNGAARFSTGDQWHSATVYSTLLPGARHITLTADDGVLVDSVTVMDRRWLNLFPLAAGAVVGVMLVLLMLRDAWRSRR
ncbi:MAG: hypothetical protein H7Y11_08695, partial [Armatimonadetes bacterium]|nr:hypothetical protein [Anaerolineae bacterium]